MPITDSELKQIAALAYLDIHHAEMNTLAKNINAIMDYVDRLQAIDAHNVIPMRHPLAINQRLREDVVTETNTVKALASIAPEFENGFYCVPTILGPTT